MCGRRAFRLSLLLLVWCVCTAFEENQVKTLETGADLGTLSCLNQTIHNMTYVICKVDRVKSGGSECQVSLRFGQNGTDSTCDPRVTLQIEGDRVFLNITNIQPSDEGNYTCECAYNGGTHFLHLNISVNGSHVTNNLSFTCPFNVMIITAFAGFVAVVVLVGIIRKKRHHNRRTQKKAVYTFKEVEQQDIEPYSTFTRRDNGLYSTLQLTPSNP
ncbi:uncharacterized protein LOC112237162 isoform X2 [Oncorhynchus tshawytscha]|uniref:uncharacterized protein LOC112237162 isoform X2 n=1 Tax=Oncorhynchus tshawytscha TaxID=74940 RepID=UPI001C3DF007|nr:uncharacterized protein LOC112237162 isoform X2 [Oncorhynchus tshawytscha]